MTVLLCAHAPLAYPAEKGSSGKQVEMYWSEVGPFIARGRVATVLPDGTALRGRVLATNEDSLVLDVSKTSDKSRYAKGRASIPRDQITTIRLREKKGIAGRVALTIAGIVGVSMVAGAAAAGADASGNAAGAALLVGAVGGGVGGYFLGSAIDHKTTIIKVLPD